jgi:hypothetical protein
VTLYLDIRVVGQVRKGQAISLKLGIVLIETGKRIRDLPE